MMDKCVYIFLDESGNFDFSANGTRYSVLTSICTERPFLINNMLENYQYDCLEFGLDNEYFHCCDDNRHVRKKIFNIISEHLDAIKIDSLIIEKQNIHLALQESKRFSPQILGYLLKYILRQEIDAGATRAIIITDNIPISKKRKIVEKSIQQVLHEMAPIDFPYKIVHHASRSHYGLQVADYCCWAIFKKWQHTEAGHYLQIKPAIRSESEFDAFRNRPKP